MPDVNGKPSSAADPSAGPTVLLVEDEVLLRMLLADELRERDYVVIEAANADAALEILLSGITVHLVLSDIGMAGTIDGHGLVSVVRNLWPQVKIVIASAHASEVALEKVHAVLSKPYEFKTLFSVIKELLTAQGDANEH